MHDPARSRNLRVSPDVKELFGYISRYAPIDVEPPTPLKPFVPDYVPRSGTSTSSSAVPRPDGLDDGLGVRVLDEPGPEQSDPASLSLKLRRAIGGGLGGDGGGGSRGKSERGGGAHREAGEQGGRREARRVDRELSTCCTRATTSLSAVCYSKNMGYRDGDAGV